MKNKYLSNQELIMFCEHMSMVLKSGLTPAAGLNLLMDNVDTKEGQNLLLPIAEKCNEGVSFTEAIADSGLFPPYACHMMEIGNTSGKLEEVMDALVYHYSREENLAQEIKSAVTYPFLIIFMMLVVMIILVIKVLPIFQQVFIQLGSELTGFSRSLYNLGKILTTYSAVFIGIFVILVSAFFFFTQSTCGKKLFARFASRFFLTRKFYEAISSARFASGMAMTISAGLDPENSLDLVTKLIDNKDMLDKISRCRKLMAGDENNSPVAFSQALISVSVFNHFYSRMLSIGFATGASEQVFKKIAENADREIEKRMNDTLSILEPTLVIFLSIIVCLILLSVIMPLMGIMTQIG